MSPLQAPSLRIEPSDVQRRRKIGTIGQHAVYHITTKGGYNLVATSGREQGLPENGVLGVGPHPGVAKFMAEKAFPTMRLTELSKSAWHQLSQPEIDAMMPQAERVMASLKPSPSS